jgi:hypothetical protein
VEIGSFEHANALASGAYYIASDSVQLPTNLARLIHERRDFRLAGVAYSVDIA